MTIEARIGTPIGALEAAFDAGCVIRLHFADGEARKSAALPPPARLLQWQIDEYFADPSFRMSVPSRPAGSEFQRRVWQQLSRVGPRETVTYTQLAATLGLGPRHVRAVAAAVAKNPLLIVVPCHRVVGSDGSLTGYAGGLLRKHLLLQHEGSRQPSLALG